MSPAGFDELEEAIDHLAVPAHGDAIVEGRALLDRLTSKLAEAEAAYAASGGWEVDGFGSMAAFLRHRTGMRGVQARQVAQRARRMADWPEVLAAWQAGRLRAAHVDATAAVVPERHVERFAATVAENIEILAPLGGDDARAALRSWVDHADALAEREAVEAGGEAQDPPVERDLHLSRTLDDVVAVDGQLDRDSGAIVLDAVRAALTKDPAGVRRTPAQRRADALVDICRFYLAHHEQPPGSRRPDRVSVVCDLVDLYRVALRGAGVRTAAQLDIFLRELPELGALERGLFVEAFDGAGSAARTLTGNPISDGLLACVSDGGVLERLLTADSQVIDMGRSVRTATDAQRRAAMVRDGGCRRPGCDCTDLGRLHVHHVRPWELGGHTDVDQMATVCDHDHLDGHRRGLTDRLEPDGTYTVVAADGTEHSTRPRGVDPPPRLALATTAEPAPPLPFDPVPVERGPDPDEDPAEIERQHAAVRERVAQLKRELGRAA